MGEGRINVAHMPKGNATGGTIVRIAKLHAAGTRLTRGTDNLHADSVKVMRWALAMARVQEGCVVENGVTV